MKRYFLFSIITVSLLLAGRPANAQVNNGEIITVQSGTYMNIQGDLLNNYTVNNTGTIIIAGDYTNNGTFNSFPNSLVKLAGDYTNNGTFNSFPNSLVKLDGATQLLDGTNPTTFSILEIAGTGDKQCDLNEYIAQELRFTNNKIIIGTNDLTLLPSAVIATPSNAKYVVTNSTGSLVKESVPLSSDFLFPVGVSSYKPVTLNYSGAIDTFAVRVEAGVIPTTGTDPECVQFTYFVEESDSSGSNNASLKLGWNTSDEGSIFTPNRAYTYMWQYNNNWNMLAGTPGAAANLPATDWYYQTSGITDFSSVVNKFILRVHQVLSIGSQPTSQSTCENNTASFSVTATGIGIQYQWQENCGSGWSDLSEIPPYSGTDINTLIINNPIGLNGCQYQCVLSTQFDTITSQPATLTVHSLPPASAGNDTTVNIGENVQLTATGGTSYLWEPEEYLDNPNISTPVTTPIMEDITYTVYVTDANGCTASDSVKITVGGAGEIYIPEIFSPNGDGENDTFYVRGHGIEELYLCVYDRWGEKVFETPPGDNILQAGQMLKKKGWDGTYKGKKAFPAVFVYYVEVKYYYKEPKVLKGNITLIR